MIGPNGAGKTTLLSLLAGVARRARARCSRRRRAASAGCPSRPPSTRSCRCAENLRLFARLERVARPEARGGADARADRPARARRRAARAGCRAATASGSTSPSGCSPTRRRCCSTSRRRSLDPRQRERLWEFITARAARRHERRLRDPRHRRGRALRGAACSCSPTASCCYSGPPAELAPPQRRRATSSARSSASCASAATDGAAIGAAPAGCWQGPADPAALAGDGRPADRLPGRDRDADRARAVARARRCRVSRSSTRSRRARR